jgi:hypothetical protein
MCRNEALNLAGVRLHRAGMRVASVFLVIGLAGCAAGLNARPENSSTVRAPYVGLFTGEYVEGRPLYRFPPISVVGSRERDNRI